MLVNNGAVVPEVSDRRPRSGVVVAEAAGELPVGVGLLEQALCLDLEEPDGIGAGGEAQGGSSRATSLTSASASLAGSPPCLPSMPCHAWTVARVRSA